MVEEVTPFAFEGVTSGQGFKRRHLLPLKVLPPREVLIGSSRCFPLWSDPIVFPFG
jgi:hypothetical protein